MRNPLPDVATIIPEMVALPEMQQAIFRRIDARWFIGLLPGFDERYHHQKESTWREDAVELAQCSLVIDMFKDVGADRYVEVRIGKIELLYVQHAVTGVLRIEVGGEVAGRGGLDEPAD